MSVILKLSSEWQCDKCERVKIVDQPDLNYDEVYWKTNYCLPDDWETIDNKDLCKECLEK